AIAQGLGHIALIAMHRLHHEFKGGIDDTAGLLGIPVFEEIHGAFDVGEQSRDGLALAVGRTAGLQRRLLGEDTFGEVARGVAARSLGTRGLWLRARARRLLGEWRAARVTETAAGWIHLATCRASL